MAKKADRIVVDTNLWISFLITKDYKKLDVLIKRGKVKILFSLELMEEFLTVVSRPKFKKYFDGEDIERLLNLVDFYREIVDVKSDLRICRDSKDDFLVSLSKDGKADFLITGDHDLLELKKIDKTRIISISEYLRDQ
jgi:putative PIN family toxin of toxin-antitoxin system